MGLSDRIALHDVSGNAEPPSNESFSHVISIDVVMHLPDRQDVLAELWRVLKSWTFVVYRCCIVNGVLSDEDIRIRSHYGLSHFVPEGFNESALTPPDLRSGKEKHSDGLIAICSGRWQARKIQKRVAGEFGEAAFEHEQADSKSSSRSIQSKNYSLRLSRKQVINPKHLTILLAGH